MTNLLVTTATATCKHNSYIWKFYKWELYKVLGKVGNGSEGLSLMTVEIFVESGEKMKRGQDSSSLILKVGV